ncbi:MAG: YigZ family protein [Bacillota bacterium]
MQEQNDRGQFYRVPVKTRRIRFNVQGSRFIATLAPVETEENARTVIAKVSLEFPDATHHAYAYRLGIEPAIIERFSDAREPVGTAGPPMLQVLQGGNISDVVVIGTRYFGGTKLGLGGLTRAYRDCTRKILEDARLKTKEPLATFSLELSYEDFGGVSRLVESLTGAILDVNYTDNIVMIVSVPVREKERLKKGFESACRGRGKLTEP